MGSETRLPVLQPMPNYLHPVSRACEEKTAETIEGLSKSELVYVLCDVYGLATPTDEDGEEIHPDDYNGNVTKEMMMELIFQHDDVTVPEPVTDESSADGSEGEE